MKMTSSKVLITGITNEARRNILFQTAVHWAEEGCKVIYITRSQFDSIPTTGHGPQIPSAEVLTKIRIVYPESLEELLKVIADILTFRDTIPRVILMEGLDDYSTQGDTRENEHGLARVCAILSHVAMTCTAQSAQPTHLLVTFNTALDNLPPVTMSMFDSIWCFCAENNTLTRKIPFELTTTQLSLAPRSDESYVLRTVSELFVKPNG